jgi:predicted nucleic acid-binding protein
VRIVIDACVAMKWLAPEADSERAREVFSAWQSGRLQPVAPALIMAEVANALWKKVKRQELHSGQAARLFRDFRLLGVRLIPIDELVFPALDFSFLYNHPVYDCIYVALAVRERSFLLTSDEPMARRFRNLKPKAKQIVRLLRDWRA